MDFYWERWETTEHSAGSCPEKALLEVIEKGLDRRNSKDLFLSLWTYWWSKSPEACVLITMTQNHFNYGREELRFWFKDRDDSEFGYGQHVDSCGYDLIATVRGTVSQLREILKKMVPMEEFQEGLVPPLPDADKHHTMPSPVVIWRRKLKHS